MKLQNAINQVSWTHNTNVMVSEYKAIQLITKKSVVFPRIVNGNVATQPMFEDEAVQKTMEGHYEMGKKYEEQEFSKKLEKAGKNGKKFLSISDQRTEASQG